MNDCHERDVSIRIESNAIGELAGVRDLFSDRLLPTDPRVTLRLKAKSVGVIAVRPAPEGSREAGQ